MIFVLLDGNEKPIEKSNQTKTPSGGKIGKCLRGTCQILQTDYFFFKGYLYIFKVYNF